MDGGDIPGSELDGGNEGAGDEPPLLADGGQHLADEIARLDRSELVAQSYGDRPCARLGAGEGLGQVEENLGPCTDIAGTAREEAEALVEMGELFGGQVDREVVADDSLATHAQSEAAEIRTDVLTGPGSDSIGCIPERPAPQGIVTQLDPRRSPLDPIEPAVERGGPPVAVDRTADRSVEGERRELRTARPPGRALGQVPIEQPSDVAIVGNAIPSDVEATVAGEGERGSGPRRRASVRFRGRPGDTTATRRHSPIPTAGPTVERPEWPR